jgi:hypothetical protein
MNTLLALLPVTALCVVLSRAVQVPITHSLLMSAALCMVPLLMRVLACVRQQQMKPRRAVATLALLVCTCVALAASSHRASTQVAVSSPLLQTKPPTNEELLASRGMSGFRNSAEREQFLRWMRAKSHQYAIAAYKKAAQDRAAYESRTANETRATARANSGS